MLKTITYNTTRKQQDKVIATAVNNLMDVYTIEGALNDTHLIVNDGLAFGRQKPRKYIILDYVQGFGYQFDFTVTATDSETAYRNFMQEYEEQEQRLQEEEEELQGVQ